MKTTALLIALLAASATLQQQRQVKGCLRWDTGKGTCNTCYRRQVATHGCGPLLPVTDTCLIHAEEAGQKTQCTLCKNGYGLNAQFQCIPLGIFNCVHGGTAKGGTNKCLACGNGQYPTTDGTHCAPLATGAIANCLWGEVVNGASNCIRCNPGYVLSATEKACVAVTTGTTGCWLLNKDGTSCANCDVLAGYSMQKSGKCKFIAKE